MGPHTPVRRDHRAKESGPRAHGNNRQFLSVAPNAILTPRAHGITDTSAFRTNAPFSHLHSGPAQRPRLLIRKLSRGRANGTTGSALLYCEAGTGEAAVRPRAPG
jgi:hypothetical protein